MHAARLSTELRDQNRGNSHDDERRRHGRREVAKQQHRRQAEDACQHRSGRNVRQLLQHMPGFGEKVAGHAVNTQQVRNLANDGDVDETFNEAAHDRRGDEAGDPAHAQNSKEEKEQADQNGERGGKRVEVCSALSCDRAHGYR
jgi:hypothetical protein